MVARLPDLWKSTTTLPARPTGRSPIAAISDDRDARHFWIWSALRQKEEEEEVITARFLTTGGRLKKEEEEEGASGPD